MAAFALVAGAALAQPERGPINSLVREGLRALQDHDPHEAQRLLELALDRAPDEARAWIGLAHTFHLLNLHSQAVRHAEEAAKHGGDDPQIQHALSMFYSDYRKWAEAARWEERFARGPAGAEEAYVKTVSLYMQAGMPRKAAEVGSAFVELEESASLHNALGKAYTMADKVSDGLRHLEKAVEIEPYEESLHYDLGYFHLRQMNFEAATEAFFAGRKYFDKSADIELGLGIAAYGQRRFQPAVQHFLRAAELAPSMYQPPWFLGRLLQHASDQIDEVVERMRIFHERRSESHLGSFLYGKALLAQLGAGRNKGAIATIEALLRKSIELHDEFWESHYELGVLLEKQRDYRSAEQHLERAVELNPEASKPHYRLARVYQRLGKAKEAERARALHQRAAEQERERMSPGQMPPGLGLGASAPAP